MNQCQNLLKRGTGSNLADVGRAAVHVVYYWRGRRLRNRLRAPVGRLSGKVCGVPESEAAGEKLGVSLVERNKVNMGTDPGLSLPPRCQCGGGQVHRRPIASGRDGASVVVRGRESRLHGEGRQRVSSVGIGMPGGRP